MLHKTLIAFMAVVALGCVPVATDALAAPHGHGGGHAAGIGGGRGIGYRGGYYGGGGYVGGPVYDSCAGYGPGYGYGYGYGYNGCPGYEAPLVGGVINGVLGGYGPY